jgi:hypothetical protein
MGASVPLCLPDRGGDCVAQPRRHAIRYYNSDGGLRRMTEHTFHLTDLEAEILTTIDNTGDAPIYGFQ